MEQHDSHNWQYLLTPGDARNRLLMAILRLLLEKEIITEKELWDLADPSQQEQVTEKEARRQWHTTWLPTEELAAKVTISPDTVILDAGSGFGGPARQLAEQFGCRVIGIDQDALRVLHAIRQTERMGLSDLVSFCWGVFQHLPFPEECFDVVWAQASVTHHDKEWDEEIPTGMERKIFEEFHRVLKHDGRLACQVWIRGPLEDDDLPRFLRLVGFVLQDVDDCTETWLACMKWAMAESNLNEAERQSAQEVYDECVQRQDKLYRFVATKAVLDSR